MSSSIFRGFVLLGLLCIWVTSTEQALTITIAKNPNLVVIDANVTLTVEGVTVTDIENIFWYKSNFVDATKLVAGKFKDNTTIASKIADTKPVIEPMNVLTFTKFQKSSASLYTAQVTTKTDVATATIALLSSSPTVISSSILLLAAVLFSSLRIL